MFLLKHSDLDQEFVFLEDISLFLPFPQLDEQLLPSSETIVDYTDFMHDLVEKEEDSGESGDSQETLRKRGSRKDNNEVKKRRRGPGRPANNKSLIEKRQESNIRERRRMRDLVRWREQFY